MKVVDHLSYSISVRRADVNQLPKDDYTLITVVDTNAAKPNSRKCIHTLFVEGTG